MDAKTKKMRDELAESPSTFSMHPDINDALTYGFKQGFDEGYAAGIEAEKERAKVLVEALKFYLDVQNYPYADSHGNPGFKASKALAEYNRGTEGKS